MQIILLVAAAVSFAIDEWSTGAVLTLLTVVNALVGLRKAGKAEVALGLPRGQSADALFSTAIALIAAIPTALPTLLQVILSSGAKQLTGENAIVKDLVSVETLGSASAINSDTTGTLTMNQMTVVEVVDPVDRYPLTGIGYGLEGKVLHAASTTRTQ